jgi:hypothetical protein
VLWLRFGPYPTHVALAIDAEGLVHAYEPAARVIAHGLTGPWRRRLVGLFDLPGLD